MVILGPIFPTNSVTGGQMRGFPQLPSFHAKSQVLEICKHEKNFKVPHNKESHKVEVLAKIYFSKTGKSMVVGRERERNISCSPHRNWEQRLKLVVQYL
jgi:hypothetical protein